MNSLHPKHASGQMSLDASAPEPRRKILSLPKALPLPADDKPLTPKAERNRLRADRLALARAEDEGMFLPKDWSNT